jgi:hypothetical protein
MLCHSNPWSNGYSMTGRQDIPVPCHASALLGQCPNPPSLYYSYDRSSESTSFAIGLIHCSQQMIHQGLMHGFYTGHILREQPWWSRHTLSVNRQHITHHMRPNMISLTVQAYEGGLGEAWLEQKILWCLWGHPSGCASANVIVRARKKLWSPFILKPEPCYIIKIKLQGPNAIIICQKLPSPGPRVRAKYKEHWATDGLVP